MARDQIDMTPLQSRDELVAWIEAGVKPLRREGRSEGRWVLLDFGDLVVHVFHQEDRQYYSLERLWKDAPVIPIDLGAPQASVEHSEV